VIDFDLQIRFWRSVTEAVLHSTDAALAAAAAWQDQILASQNQTEAASSKTPPLWPVESPTGWPSAMDWASWLPLAQAWMPTPVQVSQPVPTNPFAFWAMAPFVSDFWRLAGGQVATRSTSPFAYAFWPWPVTWAYWQMPLTAMMVSAGVPYSVASPSAKAGTAAMEAAEAARLQFEKAYAAYRTDGGHATQLVAFPWQ
jgi:hypothetical protein